MSDTEIRNTITAMIKEKPILADIDTDTDFFDVGASSLTIVDLQIQIEKALGKEVDTAKLMSTPTIDGWVAAYNTAKG